MSFKSIKVFIFSIFLIFSFCGISLSQTSQSNTTLTFNCEQVGDPTYKVILIGKPNSFTLLYVDKSNNKPSKITVPITAFPIKKITNDQGVSYTEVNFESPWGLSFSLTKRFDTDVIFFRILAKDRNSEGNYYCRIIDNSSI